MSQNEITRRAFVSGSLAGISLLGARERSVAAGQGGEGAYQLYWGDLHNHNAVGYAKGSLERSIDLAQGHLDFFAFTGHASWHDMPKMPGDRHMKWVDGFKVHADHWPKTRRLIQEANTEDFVALLGYEWHSSHFGDYCMIFPDDQPELYLPDHADKLLDFAQAKGAFAIPHHVAYKQGWRGANWKHFRGGAVTPVVEVFSEHGCSETDVAPLPYLRHSMSGRDTTNTIQPQLAKGLRFGFVASSDDHRGYPGAYGEGVLGVWARELSSDGLFEALRARRTYAATGDRIAVDFQINGHPMGSELPATGERQINVSVEGQDALKSIELVKNGRVIERHFPEDEIASPTTLPDRVKCRLQYGWGPWAELDLGRTCHWDMRIRLSEGKIRRAAGCFQAAPFGEELRDRLQVISDREVHLQSPTTRVQCYGEDPTKSVILDLEAPASAELIVELTQPVEQRMSAPLRDLLEDNVVTFTGGFTTESYIINRLVGPSEYAAQVQWNDKPSGQGTDWYYARITQHNGHMAWTSPVWVG